MQTSLPVAEPDVLRTGATTGGSHCCPADGCPVQVPAGGLACPSDWSLVSRLTRQRVYRTYQQVVDGAPAARRAHLDAVAAAVAEINTAHHGPPPAEGGSWWS